MAIDMYSGGGWINYQTGQRFIIDEHELWIRDPKNARKLEVPDDVIKQFKDFKSGTPDQRNAFLTWLMSHAPIMRVREHKSHAAFEFSTRYKTDALAAVREYGRKGFGPFTSILIANLRTGEQASMLWSEFKERFDNGDLESILRLESKRQLKQFIDGRPIRELLAD